MKATAKKVLSLVLVAALTAALAIGGTLAYLTMDTDEEKNVFLVGDINIELDEEVGLYGEGGEVKEKENGAEYSEIMPGDYLKKEVTVTNTGKHDAYVAVTVTMNNADKINSAIDDVYGDGDQGGQKMYDFIFDGWHINQNPRPGENGGESATDAKNARGVIDGVCGLPDHVLKVDFSKTTDFDNDTTMFGTDNWFKNEIESAAADNGVYSGWLPGGGYHTSKLVDDPATDVDERDYQIVYTYYLYLPVGESSTLFNGLNVPADFTREQLAMFDDLKINVKASAIQADNMSIAEQYKGDENGKAKTAFAILAGDIETPEYSAKPAGTVTPGHTAETKIWGEATTNAKESVVVKIYSGDTYLGSTSLNDVNNIIDGNSKTVTWSIALNGTSTDDYWTMEWEKAPEIGLQPTKVELWVDGEKVDDNKVKLNNSGDNLIPIVGAVVDSNNKILRYVINADAANPVDGETYVPFVSSAEDLQAALSEGKSVVLTDDVAAAASTGGYAKAGLVQANGGTIDGNGKTLTVSGANDTWDCAVFTKGGTIQNLTIGGASRGIFTAGVTEDLIVKNVTIDNVCYTFSADGSGDYNVLFTDSTLNGWTSFTSGFKSVSFKNCTFGKGTGGYKYAYCRPYTATTMTNCAFEAGYELDATQASVTLENCTVDGTTVTQENVVELLGADAAAAIVK